MSREEIKMNCKIEYSPGTYCRDIQCEHYHVDRDIGQFDVECDSCPAYLFYLWLREHGYRLVRDREFST